MTFSVHEVPDVSNNTVHDINVQTKIGYHESVEPRIAELELDNQICFALYDASRAMIRAYGPALEALGLTYPQYLVMLVLWEADGPRSVGDLVSALHLDTGTLTPLLKRLAQQGLVARNRDPEDERRVLITLTPPGRDLRGRAADVPRQVFGRCEIDADTTRALRDALAQVTRALAETTPPAGR
jgi:MarR family transcriptional regulator, organic hydroperoxide resistance regulator